MPALGVNVAVLDGDKILLTKRVDVEVWCLPGGGVEEGESVAHAAIREVREETGLEVELHDLVGVYSKLGFIRDSHVVLFTARSTGGKLRFQEGETIELRFFGSNELPQDILFGQTRRILDAVENVRGVVRKQELGSLDGVKTRRDFYNLRDQSALSRRDFYFEFLK